MLTLVVSASVKRVWDWYTIVSYEDHFDHGPDAYKGHIIVVYCIVSSVYGLRETY